MKEVTARAGARESKVIQNHSQGIVKSPVEMLPLAWVRRSAYASPQPGKIGSTESLPWQRDRLG